MATPPVRARIPVAGPWISEKEVSYVTDAAANGWFTNAAGYVTRFETAFAEYVGMEHAMALPSCTSAIHLALLAANVGDGDEVIVPELTWIASSAPATYVGATPVFADIDPVTHCLSPEAFEACITERTRAVIPVDLYGACPDMDAIREIARTHDILVLEDAAQALGSEYHGRKAGSLGDVGVFSFHGTKIITTGEGGMLVTNDSTLFARASVLRDHGWPRGQRTFWNLEVAHKYRMSNLQAALGLAQLERLDEILEKKRQVYDWYVEGLGGIPGLRLNVELPNTRSNFWMINLMMDPGLGVDRDGLMVEMAELGVDTRPFFYPLSMLPAYSETKQGAAARARNRHAYALSPHGINLPSSPTLSKGDVEHVCSLLHDLFSRAAGRVT